MPVLAASVPGDRTCRARAGRDCSLRLPAFPAHPDPPPCPRRAAAAEAAARQDRFWDLHELLFHHQHALTDDDLHRYAAQLGLDLARFDRDRPSAAVLGRIRRDVDSGVASGEVHGTPTLFIDGRIHRGDYAAATLMEALAR